MHWDLCSEKGGEMLKVESINLHWASNSRAHRTNKFEISEDCADPTPVLRRGQPFKLSINFDRAFNEVTDIVRVYFKCVDVDEKNPRQIGSLADLTVTRRNTISRDKNVWSMALMAQEGNSIHLKMSSPSNLPFASFKLHIDTKNKTRVGMKKYQHPNNVYFLFNPWNKDDKVFMPETKLLDEYVLNDVGKIFLSSGKKPEGKPWVFGQFAAPILPALMLVLKDSDIGFNKRGQPVPLSRKLTELLCIKDEEDSVGVLKGTGADEYDHTKCIWNAELWNDSVTIFQKYLESDGTPVKYGKCWVFSAIVTTAFRAIGIPCRSVTNFSSAQDANESMTVDKYIIPEDMKDDVQVKDENIWDFHVWNDVWMSRIDLDQGYGGWQAIDSTPLPMNGNGQSGPASLFAIKKGEINHGFDTGYFTAAVNADVVNYVCCESFGWDEFSPVSIEKDKVGKIILTKVPFVYDPLGHSDFQDITDQYKEREGTKEERLAFFNALRKSDYNSDIYNMESTSLVEFELKEIDNIAIGEEIVIHLDIKNGSITEKSIDVNLSASSLYYNGNKGNCIKTLTDIITIPPEQSEIVKIRIPAEDYAPKLVELAFVKVSAIARVLEENYLWAGEDHFVINLPEVVICSKEDLKKSKEGSLVFTILNPLKRKLTGCRFIYEASGIGHNVPVSCRDIMPEEELTVEHRIIPDKSGDIIVTVLFESKQLKCVNGKAVIHVF